MLCLRRLVAVLVGKATPGRASAPAARRDRTNAPRELGVTDEPARAAPTLDDVAAIVVELAGRVDVLLDRVDDLERVVWRLERGDRNRRRETL
jgi:hypothetical protein